jgi:hypothetical protein
MEVPMLRHALFGSLVLALLLPTLAVAQNRYESPDPDRFSFDAGDARSLSRMQGVRRAGDAADLLQVTRIIHAEPLRAQAGQPAQLRRPEPTARAAQVARPAYAQTRTAPQPVRDEPFHVVASPLTHAHIQDGADFHADLHDRHVYRDGYRHGYADGYIDGRRDTAMVVRTVPTVVTYRPPVQSQVVFVVGGSRHVSYGYSHTWYGGLNTCPPVFLRTAHSRGLVRVHQPVRSSVSVGINISR